MAEMYVEIVAGARRFVDKCAMNKATELTLNGRDKVSDRPNCSANLAYTVHARVVRREPGEIADWSNSFRCSTGSPAGDAVAPVLVGDPHGTLSA